MKSKKVNSLTILTLLLLLIVVGGCGINPLTPSLNELKKSLNYFPLNQYSSWNYETDNGDTLILTVTDTFYSEGNKIYTLLETSLSNALTYQFAIFDDGIYFYKLSQYNPFIKYPLIETFSWDFLNIDRMHNVFTIIKDSENINNYDNVKVLQWDFYITYPAEKYDHSYFYYLKGDVGPVAIEKDAKLYLLRNYK